MDSGKYLLDAVIMQEFALLGERLDLGGICKFKAVGLFDLKMDVRFLYIHHKFINVHKIIVTLFRIVSPVRKDIAARDRIINIEACLFEDLTTDCLFGCLPSADTTARYKKDSAQASDFTCISSSTGFTSARAMAVLGMAETMKAV